MNKLSSGCFDLAIDLTKVSQSEEIISGGPLSARIQSIYLMSSEALWVWFGWRSWQQRLHRHLPVKSIWTNLNDLVTTSNRDLFVFAPSSCPNFSDSFWLVNIFWIILNLKYFFIIMDIYWYWLVELWGLRKNNWITVTMKIIGLLLQWKVDFDIAYILLPLTLSFDWLVFACTCLPFLSLQQNLSSQILFVEDHHVIGVR